MSSLKPTASEPSPDQHSPNEIVTNHCEAPFASVPNWPVTAAVTSCQAGCWPITGFVALEAVRRVATLDLTAGGQGAQLTGRSLQLLQGRAGADHLSETHQHHALDDVPGQQLAIVRNGGDGGVIHQAGS